MALPPPSAASAAAARPAAVAPAPTFATPPAAGTPGTAPTGTRPTTQPADDEDDEVAPAAAKAAAQPRRVAPPVPAETDGTIRVTRAPLKVNPALIGGFDAFNRGDLALAQSEYERAQKADPRNTDALHGLAAIAVRQGRLDQAEMLYRRITEADPHDTVAMSALINMRGQIDPGTAESRLKTLSADQPELAAPQFALGNLYARHGRWNEAQQAYFRAYNAEPDNPDIIYNLAISLEHLRQNKLAAQYYSQAIAAAQIRTAGFDKGQAAARLRSLQP
jgi:tetratricopeptide (TPR) repeat protein